MRLKSRGVIASGLGKLTHNINKKLDLKFESNVIF